MGQIITDSVRCPICGYIHEVTDNYQETPLFPDNYTPRDGKKLIRNDDGSFVVSLSERKRLKMEASYDTFKNVKEEHGPGDAFTSVRVNENLILCVCPHCGIVFDRERCSTITVRNVD